VLVVGLVGGEGLFVEWVGLAAFMDRGTCMEGEVPVLAKWRGAAGGDTTTSTPCCLRK